MRIFATVLFISCLLTACGFKGPLHSPDSHTTHIIVNSISNRVV